MHFPCWGWSVLNGLGITAFWFFMLLYAFTFTNWHIAVSIGGLGIAGIANLLDWLGY